MGGANRYGNVTPRAEFNVWADPEAARIVITSGIRKITLVPLDATHQALVSLDDCAALRALGTPAGDAAATFTERRIQGYDTTQPMKRPHAAPVHDALAVAAIVDPAVITTHHLHVDVETKGELTVGETVVDTNFREPAGTERPRRSRRRRAEVRLIPPRDVRPQAACQLTDTGAH